MFYTSEVAAVGTTKRHPVRHGLQKAFFYGSAIVAEYAEKTTHSFSSDKSEKALSNAT